MDAVLKDPYANPKRARAILFGVLLMHVAIIAVPLIYASLTDYLNPPLIVMKVGLVDLPLGDSPDAGGVPVDTAPPATSEPAPVSVDDIQDPQPVDPLPPEVVTPPPKVEQKVEQKVEPKVEPPKPKTETKTNVTPPKPKTETKTNVTPPKTEQKKDPPKSKPLTAAQINVTTNTKTQAQIDDERKAREAADARAKAAAEARQKALDDLRTAASGTGQQQGRFGTTNPGQQGILATKEMRDYYEQLNAFIRPKWNAVSPSTVELSGKISNWPTIALTIEKNGTLRAKKILSKSGNKAIDAAVEALLASLTVVPVPPQAATIPVTLEIR